MRHKLFPLFLTAVCLALLAACGGKEVPTWQEQYDLGRQYLEAADYEQAIAAFTGAIRIDPNRGEAYIGRGDAYMVLAEACIADGDIAGAQETWQNARNDYEEATDRMDFTWELADRLADVYDRLGDDAAKEELLQNVQDAFAGDPALEDWLAQHTQAAGTGSVQNTLTIHGMDLVAALESIQPVTGGDHVFTAYYMPDTEWRAVLTPAAQELASLMVSDPDNYVTYAHTLENVYYILADWESLTALRTELFAVTGAPEDDPEGYAVTEEGFAAFFFSPYGVLDHWQVDYIEPERSVYAYHEDGRPLYASFLDPGRALYEYDDQGRITKREFYLNWGSEYSYLSDTSDFTYDGNTVVESVYMTDGSPEGTLTLDHTVTYKLNEFGAVIATSEG